MAQMKKKIFPPKKLPSKNKQNITSSVNTITRTNSFNRTDNSTSVDETPHNTVFWPVKREAKSRSGVRAEGNRGKKQATSPVVKAEELIKILAAHPDSNRVLGGLNLFP